MQQVTTGSPERQPTDEVLMQWLAAGRNEALHELHSRYAARIFKIAVQSLDRATAEDVVQDVFVAVWRKAHTFDPQRGSFRPWVFQIAHFRILNELRSRNRRPRLEPFAEGLEVSLRDPSAEPEEVVQRGEERAALRSAMEALPLAQRQAVRLAFFGDLSHDQVARKLDLPLGTAKTRIRAGLQRLRTRLAAAVAVVVVGIAGTLIPLGFRYHSEQAARRLDERALALVTSSDTMTIRMPAVPGWPPAMHATYRGRPGSPTAMVTFSHFTQAPVGQTYQAWVLYRGTWISLGTARPDASGEARLIAEGPAVSVLPEAVRVTLEPLRGSVYPGGPVVIDWRSR
jgi:RNA polymerase sigma-70 factor (ECF subfamily)